MRYHAYFARIVSRLTFILIIGIVLTLIVKPAFAASDPTESPRISQNGFNRLAVCSAVCYVSLTGNDANEGNAGTPKLTIQNAVDTVNDGGTVIVDVGVYNENVIIPFDKMVTVQGQGAGTNAATDTIVDGMTTGSVFAIDGGELNLQDMTLRNGNDPSGGGVSADFADVTLTNMLVMDNSGTGLNASLAAHITITNSTFINNTGFAGGAISIDVASTLDMSDSLISGNTATGFGGGGVHFGRAGVSIIRRSLIVDNTAPRGGGVINDITTLTIANTTISGNTATTSGGGLSNFNNGDSDGPLLDSITTLVNVTIFDNTAPLGAGIHNESIFGGPETDTEPSNPVALYLTNTLVGGSNTENCVNTFGGGSVADFNSNGNNLSDDNTCASFFTMGGDLNNATADLEPLANNGGPTETHALLETSDALGAANNVACLAVPVLAEDQRGESRPAGSGCDIGAFESPLNPGICTFVCYVALTGNDSNGGTSFADAKLTIQNAVDTVIDGGTVIVDVGTYVENVKIDKNVTITGAGQGEDPLLHTIVDGDATDAVFEITASLVDVTIELLTITNGDGSSYGVGGGVHTTSSDVHLNDCLITANTASSGGGIMVEPGGLVIATNCDITENTASDGGGIRTTLSRVELYGSNVIDNEVTGRGGGVRIFEGSMYADDSVIQDNIAGTFGGGIDNYGGTIEIVNSLVTSNEATDNGGGLVNRGLIASDAEAILTNVSFSENETDDDGAGIFNDAELNDAVLTITDGNFTGNIAVSNGGGIYNSVDAEANIDGTTFNGNDGPSAGGGIFNLGTLHVNNASFVGNLAGLATGGAIYAADGSFNEIADTSFDANGGFTAIFNYGGGMSILRSAVTNQLGSNTAALRTGGDAVTIIINATFSGNAGDAIDIGSDSVIVMGFVTVANNGGVGISASPGVIQTINSIFADNSGGNCGSGTINSTGNNISDDNTCTTYFTVSDDANNLDPQIAPLANNGGPTLTHSLLMTSPAIDHALSTGVAEDQRGEPRPQGTGPDIGAFESPFEFVECTATCYVSPSGNDLNSGVDFANAKFTIQNAVDTVDDGGDVIVAFGLYEENVVIDKDVTITGMGTGTDPLLGTVVDGSDLDSVFVILQENEVEITNLTITNGSADEYGGGVLATGATVTLSDCEILENESGDFSGGGGIANLLIEGDFPEPPIFGNMTIENCYVHDNYALGLGGQGGGIYDGEGSTVTVIDSTIANNQANTSGGGIYGAFSSHVNVETSTISNNDAGNSGSGNGGGIGGVDSSIHVTNSTISGNFAPSSGGGIRNTGSLTLIHATISNNSITSNFGAGGVDAGLSVSTMNITNTIIANSVGGPDCLPGDATINAFGVNLIEDNTCSPDLSGDPMLLALANNGGPTQTHALMVGSPAIDSATDQGVYVDQRGISRPQGAGFEIGAYEFTAPAPGSITITKQANPASGAPDFGFTTNYGSGFFLYSGESNVETGLSAGEYTVTEDVPIGWALVDVTCTGGSYVHAGNMVTIMMEPGGSVECTFYNERLGNIIINKNADGAGDLQFNFSSPNPEIGNFFRTESGLGDGVFDNIPAGEYTINEVSIPGGWQFQNIVCNSTIDETQITFGSQSVTIDLRIGEDVECTFNNIPAPPMLGSITIVKQANPSTGAPDFEFVTNFGGPFYLYHGDIQVVNNLSAGVYTITENVPIGWRLQNLACSGADTSPLPNGVSITLDAGENATCTFFDERLSNIVIDKVATGAGGLPFDFTYSDGVNPAIPFQLTDGGGDGTFDNIPTGTYVISEVNISAGWTLDSIVCDSVNISVAADSVTINLGIAETVNCTFTNVEETLSETTSLTVHKVVDWNGSPIDNTQTFTICLTGPTYPGGDCQNFDFDGGSYTWTDLVAGDYTVAEQDPGGDWTVTGSPFNVNLAPNQPVETTITNTHATVVTCADLDPEVVLSGEIIIEGNIARGRVTNNAITPASCPFLVGLAAYQMYDTVIDNQVLFSSSPLTPASVNAPMTDIPAGATVEFVVDLPDCAAQVDLFYGSLLPSLAGMRYGTRLLDAIQLTDRPFCVPPTVEVETTPEAVIAPLETVDPDADGDGLPTELEISTGLSDPTVTDPLDFDNDGTSNADEVAGGFDPYDAASHP